MQVRWVFPFYNNSKGFEKTCSSSVPSLYCSVFTCLIGYQQVMLQFESVILQHVQDSQRLLRTSNGELQSHEHMYMNLLIGQTQDSNE